MELKTLKDWMKEKGMVRELSEEVKEPMLQLTYARVMLEQNLPRLDLKLVNSLRGVLKQEQYTTLQPQDKLGMLVAASYAAIYPVEKLEQGQEGESETE